MLTLRNFEIVFFGGILIGVLWPIPRVFYNRLFHGDWKID